MTITKRLKLSDSDKVFGGVCGGIGEYFDIDPIIIRVLWGISFFGYGFGGLLYFVAWLAMEK